MDHKEALSSWFADFGENMATNIWKIAPFRIGNREWFFVLIKGYLAALGGCLVLACVLNSVEGSRWLASDWRGRTTGSTALDECIWFVFTTVHGIGFGEFNVRTLSGHLVAMACVSLGYLFTIFLMCIVMLSNLPGEKVPSLSGVMHRMVSALWPSYLVFLFLTFAGGSMMGPYVSNDPFGHNDWSTGVYFMWTVMHRMPYGDIWPNTPFGYTMVVPASFLGLLYMPYALAVVAVRCPTMQQHESLLSSLQTFPENALGRGYFVPPGGASVREVVMQEYTPEAMNGNI